MQGMGMPMGIASYRQCIEAIRKELVEKPIQTQTVFDRQASHSTRISDLHYGLNGEELADCPTRKMWEYYMASLHWNRFLGLEESLEAPASRQETSGNGAQAISDKIPPNSRSAVEGAEYTLSSTRPTACSIEPLKRSYPHDSVGSLNLFHKRCKLDTTDTNTSVLTDIPTRRALAKLHGPGSHFKSKEQALAVSRALCGDSPLVVVLGTGAGKTDTWMIPALHPSARLTIVIAPLIALTEEIGRRASAAGLATFMERDLETHMNPNYNLDITAPPFSRGIFILTTDVAIQDRFIRYLCK